MELQIARQIIDTLAQGIHPVTGEAMPDDSPYNAPPVIRALHAVSRALERCSAELTDRPARQERPNNGGKGWSRREDAALEASFDAEIRVKDIARELGRTALDVERRLVHLGKIPRVRSPQAR